MKLIGWSIKLDLRDMWKGVYWDIDDDLILHIYICIVPMVPLALHFKIGQE